jgi:predicted RNase H-like HicB family nuclease
MVVALYPAILEFHATEYTVTFPDLPGCRASGTTQDEAVVNGLSALTLWLEKRTAGGDEPPEPTPLDRLPAERSPKEVARLLLKADVTGRVLRLNISLDEGIVSLADRRAGHQGMTRSGYIASLIRADLARVGRARR